MDTQDEGLTPPPSKRPSLTRDDSALSFAPKRAMASFENLVALANYQERIKDARKMVWRDRGEPVIELKTVRACLEHASRGALRSGALAFSLRAAVNLILALIRIQRVPRDIRLRIIRQGVFGKDVFRFAGMFATFTATYKFLINSLPLIIPAIAPRLHPQTSNVDGEEIEDVEMARIRSMTLVVPLDHKKARLSLSTRAQQLAVRKRTRKWHAALAGAVAGALAIVWESKSRRKEIAQQMFVRGLQGWYNSFTKKRGIKVPHGDILVFSLAAGQIMYAFLMRPDTLPRAYNHWVGQAGKIPAECININRALVRGESFNLSDVTKLLSRSDITPSNITALIDFQNLSASELPQYAPCAAVHPAVSLCTTVPLDRFFTVFKWMVPIYGALHFIPTILFKRKAFMQDPGSVLVRAGWGTMRSSAFLGTFVTIFQTLFCCKNNLHEYLSSLSSKVPSWILDSLVNKAALWFVGFLSGLSLLVEAKRRRGELAMYVLPKALESAWVMARGRGWAFGTGKWGEVLLSSIAMGMVMSTYQNDPQHLSGFVRRILYQFIGPH